MQSIERIDQSLVTVDPVGDRTRRGATYNVLVFPGGTEIGLEIQRSLRDCKEVRLFSAGAAVSNHAPYVYADHAIVPSIDDPAWVDALNQVIRERGIDYIYPAYA